MKVLHLITTLSAGGAELQLLTLCRELKARGVDVVVGYLRERVQGNRSLRPDFEAAGVRLVDLEGEGRYDWRYLIRVIALLDRERPDLLHTHAPRVDFAGAIARGLGRTRKWVCSLHAIHGESWSPKSLIPVLRWAWRRADAVIASSAAIQSWLGGSVSADKIQVIHYGIDASLLATNGNGAGRAPSLAEGPVIGSIGRLEPGKGHDTLIRAMPAILAEFPRAALRIAGHEVDGHGRALQSLVSELGLDGRVQLLGFRSDIREFFSEIDLFAFASRSEGFGQVVVEAMAAERPVVASRIPALEEIVAHPQTGFLVDPEKPEEFAAALVWLRHHHHEAREIARRGRERAVECFSSRAMADRIQAVYSKLCASR